MQNIKALKKKRNKLLGKGNYLLGSEREKRENHKINGTGIWQKTTENKEQEGERFNPKLQDYP